MLYSELKSGKRNQGEQKLRFKDTMKRNMTKEESHMTHGKEGHDSCFARNFNDNLCTIPQFLLHKVLTNNTVYISSTCLHTLITGTSSHSPAMIIIRHIMNQIFVFCMNLASDKHVFENRSDYMMAPTFGFLQHSVIQ